MSSRRPTYRSPQIARGLVIAVTSSALLGGISVRAHAQTSPTGAPMTTAPISRIVGPLPPPVTIAPGGPVLLSNRTLGTGSRGDDVLALEQRLAAMRYDVGAVDAKFDANTWQGVVAFQKLHGLPRDGRVTPEIRDAINDASIPSGLLRNGGPDRVEVDISRQVMFLYKNDELFRVVSVSSGSGRKYCETSKKTGKLSCGDATTPRGNFEVQRRIPGWRESDLGQLYNPLYFTGGFAIHGAPSVPIGPASHGCVRIPLSVAEWFPAEVEDGTKVYLYD